MHAVETASAQKLGSTFDWLRSALALLSKILLTDSATPFSSGEQGTDFLV